MQSKETSGQSRQIQVTGIDVELWEGGLGRPVLLLHPGDGFDPDTPFVQALASRCRLIAPSHPGFGRSALPKHMQTVDDLSYFYLDLIEALGLDQFVILGLSFGGWIAAEIAVKSTSRLAGICLADTVGAKFEGPMTREIADLFSVPQYEQSQLIYHDESRRKQSFAHLPDDVALRMARNHESFCLYGWSPVLNNPKLAGRLHRINVPTHLVWGAQDRVVSPDYGRSWVKAIPGATFDLIEGAGHYPQVEQADRFIASVERFINTLPAQGAGRSTS